MRGHSSMFAAMDAVIEVMQVKDARAWRVAKAKDSEAGGLHGFELVPYSVGKDSDGDDIRSCTVRPMLGPVKATKQPVGKTS